MRLKWEARIRPFKHDLEFGYYYKDVWRVLVERCDHICLFVWNQITVKGKSHYTGSVGQGPSLLLFFTGIDLFGGQHNHVPTLLPANFSNSIESCYAQRAERPKFGHMGHQQWIVLWWMWVPSSSLHLAVLHRLPLFIWDPRQKKVNEETSARLLCSKSCLCSAAGSSKTKSRRSVYTYKWLIEWWHS